MDRVRSVPQNALTRDGGGRAEVADPDQPEPVGPIAAKYLDHLAAATDDDDLAARRREAIARLTRAHHTSPLTRKETRP